MSKRAVVSLDVGGTTVDAACVSADGELIGGVTGSASPSSGTQDEIVTELARIVSEARAKADHAGEDAGEDIPVIACALAFPAPFDYAAGVSHMTHKFQAINGVKLGSLLRERTGLPVYFLNDADAFGIGVGWRQLPEVDRFVALTIGTGLGSGFIENGRAVTDGDRVPPGGEVWHLPFRDGILEDYVAARAVTTAYGPGRSAREVSELAAAGDTAAVAAYRTLGEALGAGLAPVLARFAPQTIVLGGKVAQSLPLFAPAMRKALAEAGLPDLPVIAAIQGNLALWGAARHAFTQG
jgi:glucokinase